MSKSYSPELKAQAVRVVLESQRTVASVAAEFGVGAESMRTWVNKERAVRREAGESPAETESDKARLARLEKENRELRMKIEFLGEAAADSRGRRNGSGKTASGGVAWLARILHSPCVVAYSASLPAFWGGLLHLGMTMTGMSLPGRRLPLAIRWCALVGTGRWRIRAGPGRRVGSRRW